MIVVVEAHNAHKHRLLLEDMFRLRARVFRDRMKWDVNVVDGMEIDRFDNEQPVYIIYADEDGRRVIGSLRLLPMTGPTLLAEVFSDTLPDALRIESPTVWECTRFCVDERMLDDDRRDDLAFTSGVLFAALGEVALKAGITTILGNFDAAMKRLYRRIGCDVEVLGHTRRYGRPVFLGSFPVTQAILARVKSRLGSARPAEAGAEAMRRLAA